MNLKPNTLIIGREDLYQQSSGKPIDLVTQVDVADDTLFTIYDLLLFIDENGQTKILKNRYGDRGETRFLRTLQRIQTNIKDAESMGYRIGVESIEPIIEMYTTI